MADKKDPCNCPCFCDPTTSRAMEQTGMRYNDRSAFAGSLQMDNNVALNGIFLSQAQNSVEQTPNSQMMNQQSLTASLSTLIAAAKA